jgi:hypothetical protein
VNISEANDAALVLQHVIGATNTDREPQDVEDAAVRLTVRVGSALQVAAWKIATQAEIHEAVAHLAERNGDAAAYLADWADA